MIQEYTDEQVLEIRKRVKQLISLKGVAYTKQSLKEKLGKPGQFGLFCKLVLHQDFNRGFTAHHYHLLNFLYDGSKKHKAIKLPRGFGKSTIVTKAKAIYDICYGFEPYIVINSYSHDMSLDKLRLIKEEFEQNEVLKWIYGNPIINQEEWQKQSIVVFNRCRVQAISTGQNPRGLLWRSSRPTKIISDDILDDQDVRSPEARERARLWYSNSLIPSLAINGTAEFVNTPLHPDDLIEQVFRGDGLFSKDLWDTFHIKALDNGVSIDESWKTTEQLKQIELLDPLTFAQEYQGMPVSAKAGLVSYDDLRFYDFSDGVPEPITEVYIHTDTTHTGKQTSDYAVIGAIGKGESGKMYLIDFDMAKIDPEVQADRAIAFYLAHQSLPIKKFTYDAVSNDGFGFYVKEKARQQGVYIPLEAKKYPSDKVSHFSPHISKFKSNSVYLPQNHPQIKGGIDQLLSFPSKGIHDDFVDMLSGCLDGFMSENYDWLKLTNSMSVDKNAVGW